MTKVELFCSFFRESENASERDILKMKKGIEDALISRSPSLKTGLPVSSSALSEL